MKGEVMRILCTYRDDLADWTFAQFHYKIINELKKFPIAAFSLFDCLSDRIYAIMDYIVPYHEAAVVNEQQHALPTSRNFWWFLWNFTNSKETIHEVSSVRFWRAF